MILQARIEHRENLLSNRVAPGRVSALLELVDQRRNLRVDLGKIGERRVPSPVHAIIGVDRRIRREHRPTHLKMRIELRAHRGIHAYDPLIESELLQSPRHALLGSAESALAERGNGGGVHQQNRGYEAAQDAIHPLRIGIC